MTMKCHEGVSRGGEYQPCDKPAVAIRDHPEQGAYPVCVAHCRVGSMVPLEYVPDYIRAGWWTP